MPKKIDPLSIEGKSAYIKHFEDIFTIIDAAGMCVFLTLRYLFDPTHEVLPTRLTQMLNHATGAGYSVDSLLEAGERIFNLERMFLIGAGFTRADDTLPKRMLEEPMPEGPARGHVVELDQMLDAFYELRGWDSNGVPTPERLRALGLAA